MVVGNRQASRIDVVKAVVGDFVKRREGDRLGLILFAAHAYIQAPLTFDRETVGKLLEEADIGIIEESATAIGDAIGLGVIHLRKRPENARVLILLTDGQNTAGEVSPEDAGRMAKATGLRIHTIGVGADEAWVRTYFGKQKINPSAELDEAMLQTLASLTGGTYFRARSTAELEKIYVLIDKIEPVEIEKELFRPRQELFFWPLGFGVLTLGSWVLALGLRNSQYIDKFT